MSRLSPYPPRPARQLVIATSPVSHGERGIMVAELRDAGVAVSAAMSGRQLAWVMSGARRDGLVP